MDCARRVLAAVPPLMQQIRAEMRDAAPAGLSVPQFRLLVFARNCPGGSVTEAAFHLGVTVPTASVAVDRLVRQGLLDAPLTPDNRRRRAICLTADGEQAVDRALECTTDAFAQRLAALSGPELQMVQHAMALLQRELAPHTPGTDA